MNLKDDEPGKKYRTINGAHVLRKKVIGYCANRIHRGYLTKDMMESHDCIHKQCPFLVKREDHNFWIQRELYREEKRKTKKEKKYWEEKEEDAMYYVRNLTKNLKNFCITGAMKKDKIIEIRYVSFEPFDVEIYEFMTERALEIDCKLVPIIADDNRKWELLNIFNIDNPKYLRENTDIELLTKEEVLEIKEIIRQQEKQLEEEKKNLIMEKKKLKEEEKRLKEIEKQKQKEALKHKAKRTPNPNKGKKVRGYKGFPLNYVPPQKANNMSEVLGIKQTNFENIDFEIVDISDSSILN